MSNKKAVLIIDDNAAFVDNLREILEDHGYHVRAASTCADAVEEARAGFSVALVDLRLPDGEGTSLATRLHEMAPDSQVILLTGFATLESAVAAVRAGAWAYLMKPCAMPDLLLALEQAIRQTDLLEERRELQRRAQVAEKLAAIGRLTAGLSHEIKNPLNAAALQLAVLERRLRKLPPEAQPPLEEPLKLVRDEILRLNHVLEEFLQFASPRELRPMLVALEPLLERVANLLAPQAERGGVRLERAWQGVPAINGDEGRLQQAVMNLLLNAIQATTQNGGGAVKLEAAPTMSDVQLVVEDDGPGIPAAARRRIFEPFFTTKEGGSGLGLPLVHSVIEQHGGSITVETAASGGARFVLRLPIGRLQRAAG